MKNIKTAPLKSIIYTALSVAFFSIAIMIARPPLASAFQESGAVGVQGIIPSTPPTRGATIAVPSSGVVFTNIPISVSGLCPTGLLVKIFSNNVFVGSTVCQNGSYTVLVDLFSGQNDLVARVFDALDQPGPDSNTVIVTFENSQFTFVGNHVYLSSAYAERGAPPNTELDWPITITGGTAPYALSVDWGDGTASELLSVPNVGAVTINHTYNQAGIYSVIMKATDRNGEKAFLQVVGQATGAIQSNSKANSGNLIIEKQLLWWPALEMLPLILLAFWIGRRHERVAQIKQIEDAFTRAKAKLKKD